MTQIDLRSDTVTRPTKAMRKAMADAEVGDDVLGDDPTVLWLQALAAERLGAEAGLFFPSGCMANLVAIMAQAPPGSELICEASSHTFNFELAAAARVGGVHSIPIPTEDGRIPPEELVAAIRPPSPHLAPTGMLVVENTHNMLGGRVVPIDHIAMLSAVCDQFELPLHIDGARIFNAALADGVDPAAYGRVADSVMFCLSKGLGAPVGSMLVGPRALIDRAHHLRKQLGGGMRQVGILAAAGIHALEHHVDDLARDHQIAAGLGAALSALEGVALDGPVETNILFVRLAEADASQVSEALAEQDVLAIALGDRIRFVTHRDLPDDTVERTAAAMAIALEAVAG